MINGKRLGEVVLCPKIPLPLTEEGGNGVAFTAILLLLGCGFFGCSLGFLDIFSAFVPI